MPRLNSDGGLERKPAGYGDAMVATAGLLGLLGLPLELQGYWTEHSEWSVLPTALSLMEVPPQDKDLLGRWKPEGSDVYARSFGGRVARLQALFAGAARGADRYTRLDEREIAADLVPWLMERPKLSRDQAELTVAFCLGALSGFLLGLLLGCIVGLLLLGLLLRLRDARGRAAGLRSLGRELLWNLIHLEREVGPLR